jgi:prevent-host-death family protein
MQTINIHEAKTHLSRLLSRLAHGESFIIAKAGKPLAKLVAYREGPAKKLKRIGFMAGQIKVPDDFDRLGAEEIDQMFGGKR